MQDPTFLEAADKYKIDVSYMGGKEYGKYRRSKYDEMGKVLKSLGLQE